MVSTKDKSTYSKYPGYFLAVVGVSGFNFVVISYAKIHTVHTPEISMIYLTNIASFKPVIPNARPAGQK